MESLKKAMTERTSIHSELLLWSIETSSGMSDEEHFLCNVMH